jgi:kynurenine formamidase
MRKSRRYAMALFAMMCVLAVSLVRSSRLMSDPLRAPSPDTVTRETVERWMTELSNWGRWGDDDELGTLNLITPEKRKQAAKLVRTGISVSLARNTEKEEAIDNPSPFRHTMTNTAANPVAGQFSMDTLEVSYHGDAHTHIDALCHMFYKGKLYNGFSQQEITDKGAGKLAILNVKNGVFTRGILMDIPLLKGVPYLEPGTPIYPEDLDAWEKKAGLKVSSGDVVFIHTGRWKLRDEKGPWLISEKAAGLHASCAPWLKQRDVAMLGSDAASDVIPSGVEGAGQPIHQLVLIAMGIPIFDNCDLEAVSEEAARQNRWEFLLTAAPIRVVGGTGSPLNPIATF